MKEIRPEALGCPEFVGSNQGLISRAKPDCELGRSAILSNRPCRTPHTPARTEHKIE